MVINDKKKNGKKDKRRYKVAKLLISEKKIKKAILEIKTLQQKYAKAETMIVYRALDKALYQLGWDFAYMITKEK